MYTDSLTQAYVRKHPTTRPYAIKSLLVFAKRRKVRNS